MTDDPKTGLTYAAAGVDIDAGNELVQRIKPLVRSTFMVTWSSTPVTHRRSSLALTRSTGCCPSEDPL